MPLEDMTMNKKYNYFAGIFLYIFISLSLFISCRENIPIKEMSLAKSSISLALQFRANEYAPTDIKKAKEHLLLSHKYVKNDEFKKISEEAKKSLEFANTAIMKSLPLFARDLLANAITAYHEAELYFTERYAPDEYALAGIHLREAENTFAKDKFKASFKASENAIKYALAAKNKALYNIPFLKDDIAKIREGVDHLKSNRGMDFAPEAIEETLKELDNANSNLDEKKIKEAFSNISQAENSFKLASLKTKKGLATEGIEILENLLSRIANSKYKESYIDDINKATALLSSSKELLNKELFDESIIKSDDATKLLNSIILTIEKEEKAEKKNEKILAKAIDRKEIKEVKGVNEKKEIVFSEYVVKYNPKKPDCLWRIAYQVYKDARLWPLIYIANRDKIRDPDLIFPGQKLIIPTIPVRGEKEKGATK